ncbi:WD40 repeat-like protein [Saccharata proteae CBS 121410]|uniref:Elongator complex protein 2 n=1 Tax=Saccharata proteae CBS 121410 TaxID=1314787 RepID=A0A9P4LX48_9PEZI|nr:WD40 repeat-like protein [Saccharata proteae CBS 121410]
MRTVTDFIAAGGNRHPTAADWDTDGSGLLAFGAGNNIGLWNPLDDSLKGCHATLTGHKKTVNVVKFFPSGDDTTTLISGSADNTVCIWRSNTQSPTGFELVETLASHTASVNCLSVLPGSDIFVSGSADATLKVWRMSRGDDGLKDSVDLTQTIELRQKTYFPLTIALARLDSSSYILASAGTKNAIEIYILEDSTSTLAATLKGHEDWIRSLNFVREEQTESSDLILASASQDKYIRLWRLHAGAELPAVSRAADNPALGLLGKSLHNKAHRIEHEGQKYSITFEALLIGHEDWIYSACWHRDGEKLQLLSVSADNSVSVWESDPVSGVWVCVTRLGEISAQKGSTTATGSTGGFWIGLWAPDGRAIVSLGRTGSWRLWTYGAEEDRWTQRVAISGHVKAVKGLTWAKDGSYLLSTGSDQTTRQFAAWPRGSKRSWHEFSRPQIHGYDLNCVASISPLQFISGADEKLLRVFGQPAAVAGLLERLCGFSAATEQTLPDAANIPVLGLSNKAIQAVDGEQNAANGEDEEREAVDPASVVNKSVLELEHPPLEDHLARHLLWPETEKLYGHGYEISTVAASHDGTVVATSCRATSVDHAAIRLYETKSWRQIEASESVPAMKLHSLTVTGLEFSPDDRYLLSVGRDRLFALWQRTSTESTEYKLSLSQEKAHSRMILDASWAPSEAGYVFATAGRDSKVRVWRLEGTEARCMATLAADASVTAVAFYPQVLRSRIVLAYGTESGAISVKSLGLLDLTEEGEAHQLDHAILPSDAITQLSWRPSKGNMGKSDMELAVGSEDCSLRIYGIEGI